MRSRGECDDVRPLLGVYITGAITPDDRPVVLRHLASCERCREELAGLAGLPGLLRRPSVRAAAQPPGDGASGPGGARLSRLVSGMAARRRRRNRLVLVMTAVVLTAAAATGWALRQEAPRAVASVNVLQPETAGGVTVLADAEGYTLYWFALDTPAKSNCAGTCARRWPPVTGMAAAGTGVPGAIGSIRRPDGSVQVTYNGHPLYTAAADSVPGWARGNNVWASGGQWHAVTLSGAAPAASSSRY